MRALLSLLEREGAVTLPAARLAEIVGDDEVLAAARAAGIVRDGPRATTFACPETGCAREVRGSGRKLVAVCTRSPRVCETVGLREADLARASLSIDALARALRGLYLIVAPARIAPAEEPRHLGEHAHGKVARDVFLAMHPARTPLAALLEARERVARPTLVFVPTADAIAPALATRYAPGAHVELTVLSDALTVKSGALALARRLALVRAPAAAPAAAPAPALAWRARLPPYDAWDQLHFRLADGLTLLVTVNRTMTRLSYIDLGLAHAATREPLLGWKVLVLICEGAGAWDWTELGTFKNVAQLVSELQKTLRDAFGLADNPFERFTRKHGYKPKFRASPGPGARQGDDGGSDDATPWR